MRPEHVAKMGYVQGAQLFGLSADDMKKMRFKEKNQKKSRGNGLTILLNFVNLRSVNN